MPNPGESQQPRPSPRSLIIPPQARKMFEGTVPFLGGIATKELVSKFTEARNKEKLAKFIKATEKVISNSHKITDRRRKLDAQLYNQEITAEEKIYEEGNCDVDEKYETRHFLQDSATSNVAPAKVKEVLKDAKRLKPNQTVHVLGFNTLFFHNRTMSMVEEPQSENQHQDVGVEGSNPRPLASISASQNNLCKTVFASSGLTRQSSSPPEIIHSVSYPPRLNFFSLILIGSGLVFAGWKTATFVNKDLARVKNNNFKLSETKSFTEDMVSIPKLKKGMKILEKFNNDKLTYNQTKIFLIKLDLFHISQIEDLLGKREIKRDQEQIPGDN